MDISLTARLIRATVLAAFGGVLLSLPGSAAASEYPINACQADRANYSTQAFDDFATRGMMWKRACDPEGPGLRGLVTSNVPRAGRVPRGSRSYFVMTAPEGTRFARFTWSGQARRRDCRYALQLWASRPDGPPTPIKNVRANTRCPRRGYAQAAGWPRPRTYDINGATKIVASRSLRLSIVRVAMMPGMAQAKLLSSGMKLLPCRPTFARNLSIRNAARAR